MTTEAKNYVDFDGMKRAIKAQGLLVPYRVDMVKRLFKGKMRNCFKPVFQCELDEDVTELQRRGFAAEKVPGQYLGEVKDLKITTESGLEIHMPKARMYGARK